MEDDGDDNKAHSEEGKAFHLPFSHFSPPLRSLCQCKLMFAMFRFESFHGGFLFRVEKLKREKQQRTLVV